MGLGKSKNPDPSTTKHPIVKLPNKSVVNKKSTKGVLNVKNAQASGSATLLPTTTPAPPRAKSKGGQNEGVAKAETKCGPSFPNLEGAHRHTHQARALDSEGCPEETPPHGSSRKSDKSTDCDRNGEGATAVSNRLLDPSQEQLKRQQGNSNNKPGGSNSPKLIPTGKKTSNSAEDRKQLVYAWLEHSERALRHRNNVSKQSLELSLAVSNAPSHLKKPTNKGREAAKETKDDRKASTKVKDEKWGAAEGKQRATVDSDDETQDKNERKRGTRIASHKNKSARNNSSSRAQTTAAASKAAEQKARTEFVNEMQKGTQIFMDKAVKLFRSADERDATRSISPTKLQQSHKESIRGIRESSRNNHGNNNKSSERNKPAAASSNSEEDEWSISPKSRLIIKAQKEGRVSRKAEASHRKANNNATIDDGEVSLQGQSGTFVERKKKKSTLRSRLQPEAVGSPSEEHDHQQRSKADDIPLFSPPSRDLTRPVNFSRRRSKPNPRNSDSTLSSPNSQNPQEAQDGKKGRVRSGAKARKISHTRKTNHNRTIDEVSTRVKSGRVRKKRSELPTQQLQQQQQQQRLEGVKPSKKLGKEHISKRADKNNKKGGEDEIPEFPQESTHLSKRRAHKRINKDDDVLRVVPEAPSMMDFRDFVAHAPDHPTHKSSTLNDKRPVVMYEQLAQHGDVIVGAVVHEIQRRRSGAETAECLSRGDVPQRFHIDFESIKVDLKSGREHRGGKGLLVRKDLLGPKNNNVPGIRPRGGTAGSSLHRTRNELDLVDDGTLRRCKPCTSFLPEPHHHLPPAAVPGDEMELTFINAPGNVLLPKTSSTSQSVLALLGEIRMNNPKERAGDQNAALGVGDTAACPKGTSGVEEILLAKKVKRRETPRRHFKKAHGEDSAAPQKTADFEQKPSLIASQGVPTSGLNGESSKESPPVLAPHPKSEKVPAKMELLFPKPLYPPNTGKSQIQTGHGINHLKPRPSKELCKARSIKIGIGKDDPSRGPKRRKQAGLPGKSGRQSQFSNYSVALGSMTKLLFKKDSTQLLNNGIAKPPPIVGRKNQETRLKVTDPRGGDLLPDPDPSVKPGIIPERRGKKNRKKTTRRPPNITKTEGRKPSSDNSSYSSTANPKKGKPEKSEKPEKSASGPGKKPSPTKTPSKGPPVKPASEPHSLEPMENATSVLGSMNSYYSSSDYDDSQSTYSSQGKADKASSPPPNSDYPGKNDSDESGIRIEKTETTNGGICFRLPGRVTHKTTIKVAHFPRCDPVQINMPPQCYWNTYCGYPPPPCCPGQPFGSSSNNGGGVGQQGPGGAPQGKLLNNCNIYNTNAPPPATERDRNNSLSQQQSC